MRTMIAAGAVLAALIGTGAQAQELEVENAAARLVVIPEARGDVQVTVTPGRPGLPVLEVRRTRAGVEIDGGLRRRIEGCNTMAGQTSVRIRDVGSVRVSELPLITARVPLNAEVSAGGAVFGSIGRTNSLKLAASGCGDIRAANVAGGVELASAGSGDVHIGASREAKAALAGSGDVRLGPVGGDLSASIAGSGDIHAASVARQLKASIAGSGDVVVASGRTGPVSASIVGSGDVRIGGSAESLSASVMGSGDVRVGQVLGPVKRNVAGSGDVIVGR